MGADHPLAGRITPVLTSSSPLNAFSCSVLTSGDRLSDLRLLWPALLIRAVCGEPPYSGGRRIGGDGIFV